MKRHSIHLWPYLVTDSISLACSWLMAYWIRFGLLVIPITRRNPVFGEYIRLLLLFIPLWILFLSSAGLYRLDSFKKTGLLADIFKACAIALAISLALVFFYREYSYSRAVVAMFCVISPFSVYIGRTLAAPLALRVIPRRRALMVGASAPGVRAVCELAEQKGLPLIFAGYINDHKNPYLETKTKLSWLGDLSQLEELVKAHEINTLLFAMEADQAEKEYQLLRAATGTMTVDIQVIPWMFDMAKLGMGAGNFFNVASIGLNESPLIGINVALKRILDVFIATVILALFFIPGAIITLAIRISMGSPILFVQERLGFNGKKINVIKFRTMVSTPDGDAGLGWTCKDDPRCTPLGKWLRRFSLDEMPQFWNVIRGEMSVVGPRPEQPSHAARFTANIPDYVLRLKIRAGITGWAQINGLRGDSSIEDRLVYDLEYIKNWSLWFDIKIILLTCLRFFSLQGN